MRGNSPNPGDPALLHIDTDPGADDLLALSILLASPEVHVTGITTVAGNASLEAVTENARRLLALAESRIPVGRGAARPLRAAPVTATHIHGEDGRQGVSLPLPADEPPPKAEVVFRHSLEKEGARIVLALGPLTNLAQLLDRGRDLLEGVEIVWMGGSLAEGNVTPVAEFNCFADPDAAEALLGSGLNLRVVGLDVTRRVVLRPDDLAAEPFARGPRGQMLAELLHRLMNAEAAARGVRCATLHDPCAAAALLAPHHFRFEELELAAQVGENPDRGRLVRRDAGSGARVRYAMEVDAEEVAALCLERLGRFSLEQREHAREDGCRRSH
jgi:inosine-uridine nucleoside N-ribohydrolase